MKRVLMVDDDQFVLKLYQTALARQGYTVETATDGLAAMKALRARRPDLVVLDLMMPTFTGVDVLKFIRSQPDLTDLPVIVLSNSYMDDLAQGAAESGVQKALLKVSCSPTVLQGVIAQLVEGKELDVDPSRLLAVPTVDNPKPARKAPTVDPDPGTPSQPLSGLSLGPPSQADQELRARTRRDFIENAPATYKSLQQLAEGVDKAQTGPERELRLRDLYRKVHFVTAAAGLSECQDLAQMCSVFEALLFAVIAKPDSFTPSVRLTVSQTVTFLGSLFKGAHPEPRAEREPGYVLVVDDDALSNRLLVSALQAARLHAYSYHDPAEAFEALSKAQFDLLMLDIEMPGMDGFELCKRIRALPHYRDTPIIYVTVHTDFESRARSTLSGGNDLMSKPIFSMEVATKAVLHLLRARVGKES